MKKTILIIIFLLMCGCSYNNSVYVNVDDVYCDVVINKNNKNIIKEFTSDKYFICRNLNLYLEYYKLNDLNISDIIKRVNVGLYRDYYVDMKESDLTKDYLILVNKYNYLNKEYIPNDLERISNEYNIGNNYYLRHEAKIAFEKLCSDAKKEGIIIYNLSAYRSYDKQLKAYNNILKGSDIKTTDSVSARAGNSEHQSGLSVDVNLLSKEFDKTSEYYWMINNSYKYGFILRYPKDSQLLTGYDYEPWHYRYIGVDNALKIHEENITFDEYYSYYIDN